MTFSLDSCAVATRVVLVLGVLNACHSKTRPDPFSNVGVRSTAVASLTGLAADSLQVRITVANHAAAARIIQVPHCAMSVVVTQVQAKSATPTRRWEYDAWCRPQAGPYADACLSYAVLTSVPPGDSAMTYRFVIAVRSVLGDSLPPGRYRVAIGGNAKGVGGLAAGEVTLRQR
jgi:hypothetical protein